MIYDITIVLTAPVKVQVGVSPRLTEAALECMGIGAESDSIKTAILLGVSLLLKDVVNSVSYHT